jgi:PAT family beta-lactamase induction signal transducer AmpG
VSDDATPADAPNRQGRVRREHAWVSTTYFAEGYAYAMVNSVADILFKELGASLQVVGLTALFHLPWNLKFLWAPFLDDYETKRRWLIAIEVVLTAVILLLGLLAAVGGVSLLPLAVGFLVLGLMSATHDIAIDGFYLEALDDRDQSNFVGYRAAAYKIAMVLVGGPLIYVCATLGWTLGLLIAALIMALLLGLHVWLLPRSETPRRPWTALAKLASWRTLPLLVAAALLFVLEYRWALATELQFAGERLAASFPWLAAVGVGGWVGLGLLLALLVLLLRLPKLRRRMANASGSNYASSFVSFLAQPKVGLMLAFILLFRTGESFLMKMKWPFFDDVVGLDLAFYSEVNGIVGVAASFVATIVGGRLIARDGLRAWIWPFVLAQNVLNLLYMGLAMAPDPTAISPVTLTAVIALEHAGAGLGTAVFMVYLMRTCDPAHKAGHFAIVSALMSLSFTFAGVLSGFLAEALGFALYFAFTFVATVPSMVLIFFVPHLDGRQTAAS